MLITQVEPRVTYEGLQYNVLGIFDVISISIEKKNCQSLADSKYFLLHLGDQVQVSKYRKIVRTQVKFHHQFEPVSFHQYFQVFRMNCKICFSIIGILEGI